MLYDDIIALGMPLDDHGAIAEVLSVGRTKIVSRLIGIGAVMEALGPVDGATVLDTLDAARAGNSVIKWAWHLLGTGELDVGFASTRAQLDGLAQAGLMTQAQADTIKALAVVPDPVTSQMVTAAMEGHDNG